ncbi:hypothetical protein OFM39_36950, partial [Escherichia coli]|nr:hypothetical protein [Escherichia coli]
LVVGVELDGLLSGLVGMTVLSSSFLGLEGFQAARSLNLFLLPPDLNCFSTWTALWTSSSISI